MTLDIVDLKYFDQKSGTRMPRYLYLGVDLLSGWSYAQFCNLRSPTDEKLFLDRLINNAPFKIQRIYTDNEFSFNHSQGYLSKEEQKKDETFGQSCISNNIVHKRLSYVFSDICNLITNKTSRILDVMECYCYPNNLRHFQSLLESCVEGFNEDISFDKEYLTEKAEGWNAYLDCNETIEATIIKKIVEEWNACLNPRKLDELTYLKEQFMKQNPSVKIDNNDSV